MSEILKVAKKFRRELLSLDDDALKLIERTYGRVLERLQDRLDAVVAKIEEAQAQGLEAKDFWKIREVHFEELMAQIDDELMRYGRWASDTIKSQQSQGLVYGVDHAGQLLNAAAAIPPDLAQAGIHFSFNRANLGAVENMVGFLRDGSPLDYKFAGMADDLKQSVKDIMTSGIAEGLNPREMARQVNKAAMGQMVNTQVVCRTETLRSYRAAADETYQANADLLEGWIWTAAHQATTCSCCWGMDGTRHPLEEPLCDHCCGRCTKIPITKPWAEILPGVDTSGIRETRVTGWDSEDYFKQLTKDQQRKVLGSAKFELWQSGQIKLSDIPVLRKSDVWGDSYSVGSVDHATAKAARRK